MRLVKGRRKKHEESNGDGGGCVVCGTSDGLDPEELTGRVVHVSCLHLYQVSLARVRDAEMNGQDGIANLREMELQEIKKALDRAGGDKMKASRMLGISVRTLYRKMPMVLASVLMLSLAVAPMGWSVGQVVGPGSSFIWDANTETDLAGYKLYIGTAPGVYGAPKVLGKVTTVKFVDVGITAEGQYYAALSAYDLANNESGKSVELPFVLDKTSPQAPLNFRLQ